MITRSWPRGGSQIRRRRLAASRGRWRGMLPSSCEEPWCSGLVSLKGGRGGSGAGGGGGERGGRGGERATGWGGGGGMGGEENTDHLLSFLSGRVVLDLIFRAERAGCACFAPSSLSFGAINGAKMSKHKNMQHGPHP